MTRFEERTTSWFSQAEDVEKLMATDAVETVPRRPLWPIVVGGLVGATAFAACAYVFVGGRPTMPIVPAREVPVASIAVNTHESANVSANENVSASVSANENVNENANVSEPVKTAPEPTIESPKTKHAMRQSKGHGKGRLAPKTAQARPTAEVSAGERLLSKGHNAAALQQFQHELARNPKDTRALRGACTALGRLGRVNDAARVCRHALTLKPDDVALRARLATLYYQGGAYQWSANEWRRVLAMHPSDSQARQGLKQAQARL
jgi:Flp pilus assembly protein TadD